MIGAFFLPFPLSLPDRYAGIRLGGTPGFPGPQRYASDGLCGEETMGVEEGRGEGPGSDRRRDDETAGRRLYDKKKRGRERDMRAGSSSGSRFVQQFNGAD